MKKIAIQNNKKADTEEWSINQLTTDIHKMITNPKSKKSVAIHKKKKSDEGMPLNSCVESCK